MVEALIGAIYEDQGYEQAKIFINKEIIPNYPIFWNQKHQSRMRK